MGMINLMIEKDVQILIDFLKKLASMEILFYHTTYGQLYLKKKTITILLYTTSAHLLSMPHFTCSYSLP